MEVVEVEVVVEVVKVVEVAEVLKVVEVVEVVKVVEVVEVVVVVVAGSGGQGADDLLTQWLNYANQTSSIDQNFWSGPLGVISKYSGNYVDLVLQTITQGDTTLAKSQMKVASVHDLTSKLAKDWQTFFNTNKSLLPSFTLPGDTTQHTDVFT